MAEFNTEGLEELSAAFMRHEAQADAVVTEMLKASAEIYVKEQRQAAAGYGIRKTGGFIASIKAGNIKDEGTAKSIEIIPEGKADHGADYGGGYSNKGNKRKGKARGGNVRYATIGYIFEYGTSSISAKPWLTQGNAKAEQQAYEKAQAIWSKYVDSTLA